MRVVWLRFRPASRRCSSVCWHRGSPPSQAAYGCVEGDLSAVRNSLPLVSSSFSRLDFLYYLNALYNTPCYSKTRESRLSRQETTTVWGLSKANFSKVAGSTTVCSSETNFSNVLGHLVVFCYRFRVNFLVFRFTRPLILVPQQEIDY